ncbi:hypothetical protein [Enterobacter ludwigii]|uniref:hypothetical protein n=1 Tax=Enterobacter ludwigii TaxID=299767 RepID=UPI003976D27F
MDIRAKNETDGGNVFPEDMDFLINHLRGKVCKRRTLICRFMRFMWPGYKKKVLKKENQVINKILSALLCGEVGVLKKYGLSAYVSLKDHFSHSHPNRYQLVLSGEHGYSVLEFRTRVDCRINTAIAVSCALKRFCSLVWSPATEAQFYSYYTGTSELTAEEAEQMMDLYRNYETCFFPSGRQITGRWDAEGRAFVAGNVAIVNNKTSLSSLYRVRNMHILNGKIRTDKYGRKYILPEELRTCVGVWKPSLSGQGGVLFRLVFSSKTESSLITEGCEMRNTLPVDGADLDILMTMSNQHIHSLPPCCADILVFGVNILSDNITCPVVVQCLIPDMSARTVIYCYNLANSPEAITELNAQIKANLDTFNNVSLFQKIKIMASFLEKCAFSAHGMQAIKLVNLRMEFATAIVVHHRLEVHKSGEGRWIISRHLGRFPFSLVFESPAGLLQNSCIPEVNEKGDVTGVMLLEHSRFTKHILSLAATSSGNPK